MGTSKDRIVIFPSRANLNFVKVKFASTQRGYSLLKRKKETLILRQRNLIVEIRSGRSQLPTIMQNAIYSFNRAKFLGVETNTIGFTGSPQADIYVTITHNVVVGVPIPSFNVKKTELTSPNYYALSGLSKGGQQLTDIRNKFQEVTILLVELAAKMFANKSLIDAIKQTNQRVNALEHIILPKLKATQDYIKAELDEFEREEFFRLKKAKAQKAKNILYQENLKTDESLNIKEILLSSMEPEKFVKLRKTLNSNERKSIKLLLNKNVALETL